jgi:hypothetical protein
MLSSAKANTVNQVKEHNIDFVEVTVSQSQLFFASALHAKASWRLMLHVLHFGMRASIVAIK